MVTQSLHPEVCYKASRAADGSGRVVTLRPGQAPHPLHSPSQWLSHFCGWIDDQPRCGQYREWGYLGSGPSALAYDLLYDHLGLTYTDEAIRHGDTVVQRLYQHFKQDVIAVLPKSQGWTLYASEIAGWLTLPAQRQILREYLDDLAALQLPDEPDVRALLGEGEPPPPPPEPDDTDLDVDNIFHPSAGRPLRDDEFPTVDEILADWRRRG